MSVLVGTAVAADGVTDTIPPRPSRLRRLWSVPLAVALLGGAALIPTLGGRGVGPGEARLEVAGTATVTDADGEVARLRDTSVVVGPGTVVEVTGGTTRFEMAEGVRLEGVARGASGGRAGTTVEMGVVPTLVSGRLLAVAPTPLSIEAGGSRATLGPADEESAAARLDLRRGLTVGTYHGDVTVESATRTATVAPLRRREVAAPGDLGPAGLPLRYRADDPWDRRFLGEALTVDARITPLLSALPPGLEQRLADPEVLREVVPGMPGPRRLAPLVEGAGSGGDVLALAAIASTAPGDVVEQWAVAADLRSAGAGWGLVALDRAARAQAVIGAVHDALDALGSTAPPPEVEEAASTSDGPVDGSGAASPAPSTQDPDVTASEDGAAAPAPTGDTTPSGSTTADPATPPPTGGDGDTGGAAPDPPPPSEPGDGGGGGTVGGVVDGVGDAVDGVADTAGGVVDGVVGGVEDVVGGVVDGLTGTVDGLTGLLVPAS